MCGSSLKARIRSWPLMPGMPTSDTTTSYTGWGWVDSLVAAAIGVWVLPRTWVLLKASTNILLQEVPEDIDITEVEARIRSV